jgi:hypothetical protein
LFALRAACHAFQGETAMAWFVFAYRVGEQPGEHELEEFANAGDAQAYAVQNLALMLRSSGDRTATVALGAAAGARIRWLGGYDFQPERRPRWQSACAA